MRFGRIVLRILFILSQGRINRSFVEAGNVFSALFSTSFSFRRDNSQVCKKALSPVEYSKKGRRQGYTKTL